MNPLGDLPALTFKKQCKEALMRVLEFLRSIDPQIRVIYEVDQAMERYLEAEIKALVRRFEDTEIKIGKVVLGPILSNLAVRSTNALLMVPSINLMVWPHCEERTHGRVMVFDYFWRFELQYAELPEIPARIIRSEVLKDANVRNLNPRLGLKEIEVPIAAVDSPYQPPPSKVVRLGRRPIQFERPRGSNPSPA